MERIYCNNASCRIFTRHYYAPRKTEHQPSAAMELLDPLLGKSPATLRNARQVYVSKAWYDRLNPVAVEVACDTFVANEYAVVRSANDARSSAVGRRHAPGAANRERLAPMLRGNALPGPP